MKKIFTLISALTLTVLSYSQTVNSFPYIENFDGVTPDDLTFAPFIEPNIAAMPTFWINEIGDGADWYGRSTPTGSSNTGPAADHTSGTGVYVFMEDGSNNNPAVTLSLDSVDLSGFTDAELKFWVSSKNSNLIPDNYLLVYVDNGTNITLVDSIVSLADQNWYLRTIDLSAFANDTIKISWSVNNSIQNYQHDIAIDDVSIAPPPLADDAGVTAVLSPSSSSCLTSTEIIEVTISNFGTNDLVDPLVGFNVDGGTATIETANITITAGTSTNYTFTGTADLSTVSSYTIESWTDYGVDGDNANDSTSMTVTHSTPVAINIGNDTTICAGVDLTLDATAAFTSYIWSDGSTNSTLVVNSGNTYSVTVTDADGCPSTDDVVVSNFSFIAPNVGSDTILCEGETITLDPGTYDVYLWSDGSTNQTYNVVSGGRYSVTVAEVSTSCTAASALNVVIITPTSDFAMPASFCESDPSLTLTANPAGGFYSGTGVSGNVLVGFEFDPSTASPGNYDVVYDYTLTASPPYLVNPSGTFSPLSGTGTGVSLGDDAVSTNLPIGFTFDFFGITYTDFYISSNGFISFQNDGNGCCSGQAVPNGGAPNNLIAFAWSDLNPNDGGTIDYLTVGVAPNRILVVNINGIPHYGTGGGTTVTAQILIYEGSNIIEIHTTDAQSDGGIITQGIENFDGTIGYSVPGRNAADWTASNDFVQFVPLSAPASCSSSDTVNVDVFGSPTVDLGLDTAICDPSIYTLDAGNSGSTYVWNDGSTSQTLAVDTTGSYSVTITSPDACVFIDSIYILDIAAPIVDLGSDINACIGDTVAIGATIPSAVYSWNTGDTTSTIGVSSTGQYILSVTKCSMVIDTVRVTFNPPPIVDLGQDRVFCYDEYVELDAGVFDSYLWSVDGSTNQLISDSSVQCTYTLEMYDSFGDGWNGNTFDLYQDGVFLDSSTAPNAGVSTGSGPHFDYFTVTPGTMLSINHDNSGPFQAEVSYSLYDGFGNLVYEQLQGTYIAPATNIWSGAAVCPAIEGEVIVTVADINGCINSDTVNISRSNPDLDLGSDTSICAGTSLTADAGIHASYIWSDGSTNQTLDLLTAGTYYVTVTDSIGCSKTDSIALGINALPTVDLGNDTSICNGSSYMLDAGAGMMIYNWNGGDVSQLSPAMLAGTYSVTITDGNGCIGWDSIDVATIMVVVSTTTTDASCGNSDGSATAMGSAGMTPYTYLWSDGDATDANTGLVAGLYDVTVTDNYGCTDMGSVNVLNSDGPQVSSTTVTPNLCFGDSDGMIDISITGGVTAYSFAWNNGSTDMNLSGLQAGNYNVTVTDGNGCEGYATDMLVDPTMLSAGANVAPALCNGSSDGMLTAVVSGGTSGFTFMWNTGATDANLSGLATGNYDLTVTDANGCVASTSVTLGEPATLSLTVGSSDASCNGLNNGFAGVVATGGTLAYTYMWDNGSTTANINGLAIGSYGVTVTDGNGCSDMSSVTISEPTLLSSSVTITDATCGNLDGSATVSATGGSTPYFYGWSNGNNTASITAVLAGSYDVTVSDNNGCISTNSAGIINSNGPSVSVTAVNPLCFGNSDGSATLSISGGSTPYIYLWNNGAQSSAISGLLSGTYQVTVADMGGCLGYSSAVISDPSAVSVTATATDETYASASNGTATAVAAGGTGVFTYAWSNSSTTDMVAGLAPNSYSVTASDANGCDATTTVTITASTITCGLSVTATATDATCNGDVNGTVMATSAGAFGTATYSWSNGGSTASVSGLMAGTYSVTVSDSLSCTAMASVTVGEPAALFITLGVDTTICDNVGGLTLDAGAGFASYAWSTAETTQSVSVNATATYSVTATDGNGCTASDDVNVTVDVCGGVDELSNVFSVDVYPNPTKGQFVINVNSVKNTEANISIYSVEGKLVYTNTMQLNSGITSTEVELTGIATGVYHIELTTETESSIEKLIIE